MNTMFVKLFVFISICLFLLSCAPDSKTPPTLDRQTHIDPIDSVALDETTIDQFIAWASRSNARTYFDVRSEIIRARDNDDILIPLFDRYDRAIETDLDEALIILGIIGELKNPASIGRLEDIIWQELPPADTVYDAELTRRDVVEMLQSKAVECLAYVGIEKSYESTLTVIATHPSMVVRGAAIDAYLFNNNDSPEAKRELGEVVRTEDRIFLERVRKTQEMDIEDFNRQMSAFYRMYPEEVAPEPGEPTEKPLREIEDTLDVIAPPEEPIHLPRREL